MAGTSTVPAPRTRRRGLRRGLVVAALAAVLIAVGAAPAHANVWQLTDNFENNPAGRWVPYASADGGGSFSNVAAWSHSGSWHAFRWVRTGFSSVHRNVYLTPAQLHQANCLAAIYVQAVNYPAVVNFEVIDPASWTYISLKTAALNPGGYQQLVTPSWAATRVDVVVRVSVIGYGSVSDIRVDDLTVQCVY
jgi:hypothetical protein